MTTLSLNHFTPTGSSTRKPSVARVFRKDEFALPKLSAQMAKPLVAPRLVAGSTASCKFGLPLGDVMLATGMTPLEVLRWRHSQRTPKFMAGPRTWVD